MKICPTCNRLYRSGTAVCPRDGNLLNSLREWQPGDSVSERFRIVEKIGHGSLGPAFKAKVQPFGGIRALKCLSVELADDEHLVERFRREIQAVSALRHLNAVHTESLERAPDGRPFIVMEYVPGLTLRELLSRGGYMPAPDVVDIMGQICAALDCAHWQGVIHRNLKPDNVIIAEEHDGAPRVKVMELGMANLREAAAELGKQVGDVVVTDQGTVVGTVEYMSPEQASGRPTSMLDGRSDLYSVGVMMFEALTGDLPIAAEDPMGLLRQKQEIAANELLCGTLLKALQRDPDYRFQSATEMIAALREVSYSFGRRSSVAVESDTGTDDVRVPFSTGALQQAVEDVQDQPQTSAGLHKAERNAYPIPERGPKPLEKPAMNTAAVSTDRTLDEIRKAWPQAARRAPARGRAQSNQVRTSLLVVGFAMIAVLASWLVYRDRVLLSGPRRGEIEGRTSLAPQQVPARDAASDLRSREFDSTPAALPQENQGTTTMKHGPSPPPAAVTGDDDASPRPQAAGQQSDRRGAQSATAVSAGERHSGMLAEREESPGSIAPNPREVEIKDRIAVGWFHVGRKDYRAAIDSFAEALKIDPSNAEAQAALRLARFASQNPTVEVFPSDSPAGREDDKKGQP